MTINLTKCPFCGGYPICTVNDETYRVSCDMCLASGAGYGNEKVAAEHWNRRICDEKTLDREREVSRRYQNVVSAAITYLSQQIDGDNPALDQTLSEAIRILEGNR